MQEQSTEPIEWRPVVGYDGWYEVSSQGDVRRVRGGAGTRVGRPLRAWLTAETGYPAVTLSRHGKQRKIHVHVIVAAAFLGPCPPGHEVNHKDLNRQNARASNLEYLTRGENIKHGYATNPVKRKPATQGEKVNTARLIGEQVRAIRSSAEATAVLAQRYGVCDDSIRNVRRRTTWKHIA